MCVHNSDLWPLERTSLSDTFVSHPFFPGSGVEVGEIDILQILRTWDIIEIDLHLPRVSISLSVS